MTSSRRLAWLFTVVAVLLAVGPGISAIFAGHVASYDAGLAVLTATLIAIVWYTHFTYQAVEASRYSAQATRESAEAMRASAEATQRLAEVQEARREAHGTSLARLLFEYVQELGAKAAVWDLVYDQDAHEKLSERIEAGTHAGRTRQEEMKEGLGKLEDKLPEMVEMAKVGYPGAVDLLVGQQLQRNINEAKYWMPDPTNQFADFEAQKQEFLEALDGVVNTLASVLIRVSEEHHDLALSNIERVRGALRDELRAR